jgi:hypothetical protein
MSKFEVFFASCVIKRLAREESDLLNLVEVGGSLSCTVKLDVGGCAFYICCAGLPMARVAILKEIGTQVIAYSIFTEDLHYFR